MPAPVFARPRRHSEPDMKRFMGMAATGATRKCRRRSARTTRRRKGTRTGRRSNAGSSDAYGDRGRRVEWWTYFPGWVRVRPCRGGRGRTCCGHRVMADQHRAGARGLRGNPGARERSPDPHGVGDRVANRSQREQTLRYLHVALRKSCMQQSKNLALMFLLGAVPHRRCAGLHGQSRT